MDTLNREARSLRTIVTSLAKAKQARRFSPELEARIVDHARRRVASGASLAAISKTLDVAEPTLSRFLRRAAPTSRLVPVSVVEESRRLVIRAPCGVTVEGDVDDIAALIARLSCLA